MSSSWKWKLNVFEKKAKKLIRSWIWLVSHEIIVTIIQFHWLLTVDRMQAKGNELAFNRFMNRHFETGFMQCQGHAMSSFWILQSLFSPISPRPSSSHLKFYLFILYFFFLSVSSNNNDIWFSYAPTIFIAPPPPPQYRASHLMAMRACSRFKTMQIKLSCICAPNEDTPLTKDESFQSCTDFFLFSFLFSQHSHRIGAK